MKKEILTIKYDLIVPEDPELEDFATHAFGENDNVMYEKLGPEVFLLFVFYVIDNIKIAAEVKAYNVVKISDRRYKCIQTYLDEAININASSVVKARYDILTIPTDIRPTELTKLNELIDGNVSRMHIQNWIYDQYSWLTGLNYTRVDYFFIDLANSLLMKHRRTSDLYATEQKFLDDTQRRMS